LSICHSGCGGFKEKINGKWGLSGVSQHCYDPVLAARTSSYLCFKNAITTINQQTWGRKKIKDYDLYFCFNHVS